MKPFLLSSALLTAVLGAAGGAAVSSYLNSAAVTAHAQGKSQFAPGHQNDDPGAVGTWFGVARPCPATGDDAGHAAFCQAVCGLCPATPGTLPPEVPMMPTVHGDGTVTVNDAGSIAVFHTTAQGAWAADPDPTQPQFAGKTRYQASFVWMQGDGAQPGHFIGVARPRFVMYFDPKNPDNMIGYIQPLFFPIVNPATGLVNVEPSGDKGSLDVTNHYPVLDFLAKLPKGCTPFQEGGNCFGTFHFTIHRVKANVPN
jgi:hypothetical protein